MKAISKFPGLIIIMVLNIAGCSKKLVQAPAPVLQSELFTQPISVINIPVQIDLQYLQTLLNKNIQGLLYEDNDLHNNGNDNVMLKIWKLDQINIRGNNHEILYSIPIKLWAKGGFDLKKFGLGYSNHQETTCSFVLNFSSKIAIQPDWDLRVETRSRGYNWIEKPYVQLGFLKIPISWLADKIIPAQQESLSSLISEKIIENTQLKNYAKQLWNQLLEPQQINKDPNLWLSIKPIKISMKSITAGKGKLGSVIGMKANIQSHLDIKPNQPAASLFEVEINDTLQPGVFLSILVDIPYHQAIKHIKPQLIGKKFISGNGKKFVVIEDFDMYPSQGNLITKLNLSGYIKGTVYLEGIPYYDSLTSSLKIKNLDFHIDSKNTMVKTASWLAHSSFVKRINSFLILPIGKEILNTKQLLQNDLNNIKLAEPLFMNGEVLTFAPKKIILTKECVKVIVIAEGNINVSIR